MRPLHILFVSLVSALAGCPEDSPVKQLLPDGRTDGLTTPDVFAEVSPLDTSPTLDAASDSASVDTDVVGTDVADSLTDLGDAVPDLPLNDVDVTDVTDASTTDSALDSDGPGLTPDTVTDTASDVETDVETDSGPPPAPDCGLWPLIAPDPPGPGDVDFPYGFTSGAVRENRATVVVPTLGPATVRVHASYGPNCAPTVSDWVSTNADSGFVAHIPLTELFPHQVYRYAIEQQGGAGLTSWAWFVTAPVQDVPVRIAFSGDIGSSGSYTEVYDELITTGAELLLSLGDWPYADLGGAAASLEDFRDKHRSHRSKAGVRDMMRFMPIHGTWDDHEVTNDWDGADNANTPQKVADGMQAWHEFFPIEGALDGEIYRRHSWGPNIDIFWLDLRQHRDANSAPNDSSKTMMGSAQFQWLTQELSASTAAFKLIMTSVPLDFGTTGNDHWPGFASERDALVNHIVDTDIDGVLFLTADQHWLAVHHFQHGIKEFQVGPLAQFIRTPDADVPPWVLIQEPIRNYGLLDYVPASADGPASLTFTCWADGGELLWSETVLAGRGSIVVEAASPLSSWRLVGAHTFYGAGAATIDYAVPGDYTIEWLSGKPGDPLPPSTTLSLSDGATIAFSDGSGPAPTPVFEEDFDGPNIPAYWTVVEQGVTDTTSDWQLSGGAAVEAGNCYDYQGGQSDVPKLGTFLWNENVVFSEGFFVAHLYQGDDDGMGLMYAVQDEDSYYRVSVDAQRSFARLVRVDDGLFTTLDEDLSFAPPLGVWYTLAVERTGDSHTVYLDGTPILTATDAAYGSGSVALYCYGMDDGRFDNIGLYP